MKIYLMVLGYCFGIPLAVGLGIGFVYWFFEKIGLD